MNKYKKILTIISSISLSYSSISYSSIKAQNNKPFPSYDLKILNDKNKNIFFTKGKLLIIVLFLAVSVILFYRNKEDKNKNWLENKIIKIKINNKEIEFKYLKLNYYFDKQKLKNKIIYFLKKISSDFVITLIGNLLIIKNFLKLFPNNIHDDFLKEYRLDNLKIFYFPKLSFDRTRNCLSLYHDENKIEIDGNLFLFFVNNYNNTTELLTHNLNAFVNHNKIDPNRILIIEYKE